MRKIYFLFSMLFASVFSMAQITVPLSFETGTFTWTDFSGGMTTTIDNPEKTGINVSNKVAKTIKMAGDPWGGSWIGLTAPIDFSTMKTMRMKVYSPRVGAKVTLKVENGANGAINLEKEKLTTVANAWEDLTFDFSAILLPNTYDRVVVIFDNGTIGNGSANFTFLFDDIRQEAAGSGALTLPTLPINFESATVDYTFTNFDGGGTTVIANAQKSGINTSDTVAQMVKSAGQPWGGSLLTMAGAIDFTTNKTFKVKVFSPRANAKLLLKVEGGGAPFEREVTMTKANEWEELTFDYSAVSTVIQYNKLVFIFDLGTMGDGSANFTFLFDDIRLISSGGGGLTQMNLPVTFDDPTVNYGLSGFGGADASSIVVDPTNAGNKVGKVIKSATAELWAGTTITALGGGGFSAKIPFVVGSTFMNVRVWSPDAGIKVRLKVEDSGDPTKSVETEATTTVAGGWQNLVFDFTVPTVPATAPINYAFNYNKASIFFNFGVTGAVAGEKTYYFDDVLFGLPPTPPLTQMNLPVTFDNATVNYGLIGFGGAEASTIVADPTNAANKVAKVIKSATAELWAGTTITAAGSPAPGFSSKIPFAVGATFMNVRVWSPNAGIPVRLKVEDFTDGGKSVETEATTTVAGGWQTLVFDFANQAAGTAAINFAFNYNKASIFFNFGVTGAVAGEKTYYFDDVLFGLPPTPPLTQMNLPVTFDNATVNYGLIGFGGAEASTIVADPTNAANKVAKVIKSATAELWAGTTVTSPGAPAPGFSSKIPFAVGATFMNVRVWSPNAGIQVRLKVEDFTDGGKSVETEATTTNEGWQNLVFNFANQAGGTAAINYAFNYNKASIFFNFGVTGATAGEKTYYFDDMVFGADPLPVKLLSFNAEKANQAVQLSWTTTNEVNNKEFGVQRSETGEKWNDIAVVKGQGTSNGVHTYSAEDKMPLPGVSYYRLRQTDLDGASVYSKVKVIDFSGIAMDAVKVYPNPAKGRLNVIANTFDGKVGYTIVGVDGRQVGSGMLQNTISATGINISNLKAGMYILKLQNNEKIKTVKFMVQ